MTASARHDGAREMTDAPALMPVPAPTRTQKPARTTTASTGLGLGDGGDDLDAADDHDLDRLADEALSAWAEDLYAELAGEVEEEERPDVSAETVTGILVSHNGVAWLADVLAALDAQIHVPQRIVVVDTGSTDGSRELLDSAYDDVVGLAADTGYGAAVQAGLEAHPAATEWLWLLHDDAAPEPDALQRLLEYAVTHPGTDVVGPKVLDWAEPRRLVEVGLSCDLTGRRETHLEPHELDQGQRDLPRQVLAVGSAGALVRRSTWERLGGFDPALPLFRDDIDFGWRVALAGGCVAVAPAARIRHARAASTGQRALGAIDRHAHRTDRRHAVHTVLANVRSRSLPLVVPRLALGIVLRALGYLLTKRPTYARDEMSALSVVLAAPRRIRTARRWRSEHLPTDRAPVAALLTGRSERLRGYLDAGGAWLSGATTATAHSVGGALESGPSEDSDVVADDTGLFRRIVTRPTLMLVTGMSVLALVAEWQLVGSGSLFGGRLLPAPVGASDLWSAYAGSWHPASAGSPSPASPWMPVLAVLATVLLGKAWLAVDVLVLGAVPLAAWTAYRSTRGLVERVPLRLWAAVTYALLPVATGAVAAGRFDACAVLVVLPPLVRSGARLLADPVRGGWRRAWTSGLLLAVGAVFWPPLWALFALVLVLGLLAASLAGAPGIRLRGLSVVIVLAVPPLVSLPWLGSVVDDPKVLLVGLGRAGGVAGVTGRPVGALDLLTLRPGGPGQPAVWVGAAVVLAGLSVLLRADRQRQAMACWGLVTAGLLAALGVSRLSAGVSSSGVQSHGYPGPALALAGLGLVVASVLAADGARARLATRSFGWRQPVAVLVAAGALLAPVAAAAEWLLPPSSVELTRGPVSLLPAFVQADSRIAPGQRVLVLRKPSDDADVSYAVGPLSGAQLGDEDVRSSPRVRSLLDSLVADVSSPRGSDASEALSTFAVLYVAVPVDADHGLSDALDSQSGLSRVAYEGDVRIWRTTFPVARLQVLDPALGALALQPVDRTAPAGRGPTRAAVVAHPPLVLPSSKEGARATVRPGVPDRLLVLAEAADGGWSATVDGRALPRRTAWGWAQAFVLPENGGQLRLWHSASSRHLLLLAQLLVVVAVVVMASPEIARGEDEVADAGGGRASGEKRPAPPSAPGGDDSEPTGDEAAERSQEGRGSGRGNVRVRRSS